ncbi:helix-turn-helix transcriptional regulator [Nitrospirillum viridazoti]|uniref:DNA-binding transcriptional regulator n=1 Tax=Nitrospirillum viridazoti CBAmc TaxID=1441467 RepID=A0A248JPI6_9PROT|nr:YafY family protein [Nitrospirillum amazonense]ASG20446.1 DNA-binding transcriptional regulator [Nitrospirillum amazonense CBAmc]TWB34849.1 putative DNA-binding transcriptional regulator YafY [Nitrospirillum amazonense]
MARRAERLLILLDLLRGRPVVTAATLAEALEVSARTVYRDIEALLAAGVPIRGEAGVGFSLGQGYFLPPLTLTEDEAEILAFGARVLSIWSDGALAAQAEMALTKIRAVLPKAARDSAAREILWAPPWVTRHPPAVDLLQLKRAAQRRQYLRITYETLNGTLSERSVRPLSLSFFGPVWLLIAWCELKADFRCFRLDRLRASEVLDQTFRDEPGKRLVDFRRAKGEAVAREMAGSRV